MQQPEVEWREGDTIGYPGAVDHGAPILVNVNTIADEQIQIGRQVALDIGNEDPIGLVEDSHGKIIVRGHGVLRKVLPRCWKLPVVGEDYFDGLCGIWQHHGMGGQCGCGLVWDGVVRWSSTTQYVVARLP